MSDVISPTFHAPLLMAKDQVIGEANIPEYMLYKSMSEFCFPSEIEYITNLTSHAAKGKFGLCLHGHRPNISIQERFMVAAAACLRNYISARVTTLQSVIEGDEDITPPPKLVLISNFFLGKEHGGSIAEWHLPKILGWMYRRHLDGLQTAVYVRDLTALDQEYGAPIRQHIDRNFYCVDA